MNYDKGYSLNSPYHKKGLKGSRVLMQIGNKRG